MTTPNLGWFYYREFYNVQREEKVIVDGKPQGIKFSFNYLKYSNTEEGKEGKEQKKLILKDNTVVLKERSKQFFDKKLSAYNPESYFKCKAATNSFELTTTYPGLLCGVGYNHGISSEADFKVGFYFDHTSGLPVIPGSSVKGILRSVFPGYVCMDDEKKPSKEKMEERYKFFRWIVKQTNIKIKNPALKLNGFEDNNKMDVLEAFTFDGLDNDGNHISYYKRDCFFDAYPLKSLEHDGCFLKNDYITPHINRENPEMSPFSNPIPLQFLKVLSMVKFCFQFKLVDGGGLIKEQKMLLFKEILCFLGAGAKTNVGYGQFEEGFLDQSVEETIPPTMREPKNFTGRIKNGDGPVEAKVINKTNKKVLMKINGQDVEVNMSGNCPDEGKLIKVVITDVDLKTGKIRYVKYQGDIR